MQEGFHIGTRLAAISMNASTSHKVGTGRDEHFDFSHKVGIFNNAKAKPE
jgi:hypothetical protein